MAETTNYIIKDAKADDLKTIARCHKAAFPDSLTSLLGIGFITDMLKWYLSGSNKFLYWIEENGKCIGYCGGYLMDGRDAYGASSGMTQFGFNSALRAMIFRPWLFLHPEILAKYKFIWTNIKRRLIKQPATVKPENTKSPSSIGGNQLQAGLVVIGVSPELHKKGLGTLLQQEFERRALKMGATLLSLSVRKVNNKAISSYQRNGWNITDENGPSHIMTKRIN